MNTIPIPEHFRDDEEYEKITGGKANFETVCSSTDREEWLKARVEGVGASEIAAIIGSNDWAKPYSVYDAKVNPEDHEQSEPAYWGSTFEPLVALRFANETGFAVYMWNELIRSKARPWQIATCDAVAFSQDPKLVGPGVLEVKCTSLRYDWGDGVPRLVKAQLYQQMIVTGFQWGAVAVLFRGNEFRYAVMQRPDEAILAWLTKAGETFWNNTCELVPPPVDGHKSTEAALRHLYPEELEGEVIKLPEHLLAADENLSKIAAQASELEEAKRLETNRIREALKDAEVGLLPNGAKWTYRTNKKQVRVLRRSEAKEVSNG